MSKKKIIFTNGIIGLVSQFLAQILQFFIRKVILQYIGVEILGISSTLTSVISMLSLSEMGFQQAVVFCLYKPLNERDCYKINRILTVLKRVYEVIGIIFILGTLVMSPFLKYILKGIIIDKVIILYYFAICMNMVMSYMLSYRRALLYADQREYISKTIDTVTNIVISAVELIAICYYKSFAAYLILQIMQTIISNVIVNKYCDYNYNYINICKFEYDIFKDIFEDVKNVFVSKLAGFVYGATDNLVISVFAGTVNVGYLSNYTVFITALKQIINSIFNSMTPIIGNMLVEDKAQDNQEEKFQIYAYVRYILSTIIVVPWLLLANDLIQILFGIQYVLDNKIVVLLAIDLYIHIVYSICCEYINGCGYFKFDRNIAMIGACINLICSIMLVFQINIYGVLAGTVISQMFFWAARSWIVYKNILLAPQNKYWRYLIENIFRILIVCGVILISRFINDLFTHDNILVSFIRQFTICEAVNLLTQIIVLGFDPKRKIVLKILKKYRR